jgi:hypothetical protein
MRNNVILLLIFTIIFILSCTDEYDITVINKSDYSIDFEFTTGYRLGEYHLDPGGEWNYSLSKALGHSMGTIKPLAPSTTRVDYRFSDNVYTFYNAYALTFSANGGVLKKDQKALPVLIVIKDEEIQLPDGNDIWENGNSAGRLLISGWATTASGTGTGAIVYNLGTFYSFNVNRTLYAQWK